LSFGVEMNQAEIWQLIDKTREESQGDQDQQLELMLNALASLPEQEILDYEHIFEELMDRAYNRDLWAAAYIINGGCSEDGFKDFRAWLISLGLSVYAQALNDPESLMDIVDCEFYASFEPFLAVSWKAWEQKTGKEFPHESRELPKLTGEDWDDSGLKYKYPKMLAKYSPCWKKKLFGE
jgi:hypothetical protein